MTDEFKGSYPPGVNEEYSRLLDFIKEQKAAGGGDEEDSGVTVVRKREVLRPWKVREIRVNKNGEEESVTQKVPASWLETSMQQGVSASDVAQRRATFGYNELEAPTENLLLKFIGFFKGPILYGEFSRQRVAPTPRLPTTPC